MTTKRSLFVIVGGAAVILAVAVLVFRSRGGPTPDLPNGAPSAERLYRGKTLDQWRAQLKSPNEWERAAASVGIAGFGRQAQGATADLLQSFEEPGYRASVANALLRVEADPNVLVPAMIKALETPNDSGGDYLKQVNVEGKRKTAAYVLGRLGPRAADAVDALIKMLPNVQEAEQALAQIGPTALPRVTAVLDGSDAAARLRALGVIARMGPDAADVIPRLVRLSADADPALVQAAFKALGRIGPAAVDALGEVVDGGDAEKRFLAVSALYNMGRRASDAALPLCSKAIRDPDDRVRITAAAALVQWNGPNQEALPLLVAGRTHADGYVSNRAATALRSLGRNGSQLIPLLRQAVETAPNHRTTLLLTIARLSPPDSAVAVLIELLGTADWTTAAYELGPYGPAAAPALPHLLRRLKATSRDQDPLIYAIGQIGPAAKAAVPDLLEIMRNGRGEIPARVMFALGTIGPDAEASLPDLLFFLRTDDPKLRLLLTAPTDADVDNANRYLVESRRGAVYALARIGSEGIAALAEELGNPRSTQRPYVLKGLAEARVPAIAAVPALEKACSDEDPRIRILAAKALWRAQNSVNDSLPVLIDYLKATRHENLVNAPEDEFVVEQALDTLGEMGPAAAEAIPQVKALVENGYSYAAEALYRIDPGSELALAVLKRELTLNSIFSLKRLGPPASPLLPDLLDAVRLSDYQHDLTEALKSVDPKAAAEIGVY